MSQFDDEFDQIRGKASAKWGSLNKRRRWLIPLAIVVLVVAVALGIWGPPAP